MIKSSITLKSGSRSSNLAVLQTKDTCRRLNDLLENVFFEPVFISTSGDKNRTTDLRNSPSDFFTDRLDEDIISGKIDCAIHSAKDLPYPEKDGIDWFWLPWNEAPGDVCVTRVGENIDEMEEPIVGVSSDRREKWCREYLNNAILKPIRGNIEERIEQLDNGYFDILVMAEAALNRLSLQNRILFKIPPSELPPPEGQGFIAITYKKGNKIFEKIRTFFMKPVFFVGAGCGSYDKCTLAGIKALEKCNVVLYDALIDKHLLSFCQEETTKLFVGKRAGEHYMDQNEITYLISYYARQGKRVVRLKGGDSSIYGRLKEEIESLDSMQLPYKVVPGVSSLTGATTPAGIIMTGRGVSSGFTVFTKRVRGGSTRSVPNLPKSYVMFMSVSEIDSICGELISDGWNASTPAALIFNGGLPDQTVVYSTIKEIKGYDFSTISGPGLIVVGENAKKRIFGEYQPLSRKKILLVSSKTLYEKYKDDLAYFDNFGANIEYLDLVKYERIKPSYNDLVNLSTYSWIILSSPTAIKYFLETLNIFSIDIRTLGKIAVSGKSSNELLKKYGIIADYTASGNFSSDNIYNELKKILAPSDKVLRITSDRTNSALTENIRRYFAKIDELMLYKTVVNDITLLGNYDAVFFTSPSLVNIFHSKFDINNFRNFYAIGKPTYEELKRCGSTSYYPKESSFLELLKLYAIKETNKFIREIL